MKKNKIIINKAIAFIAVLAILSFGALSCSAKAQVASKVSAKEIQQGIKTVAGVSDLQTGDEAKLKKLYAVNSEDLDGFVLYTAPSNIRADEIAILKVKDAKKLEDIKNKLSKRVEKQAASFKDYLPKEYAIIEKHVLKTQGNYVVLIISKDADKIEACFDKLVK